MTDPAVLVVETTDFNGDLDALQAVPGFRMLRIMPADDPSTADFDGFGLRLELRRSDSDHPAHIEVITADADRTLTLPGGSTIAFVTADEPMTVPAAQPELVVAAADDDASWVSGRAGMRYRDLLPGRWGGRFIASHIHLPGTAPVPDYVHYHRVRFQLIAVKSGSVEVVYEDQGDPFVMHAGDCVLQPPEIRHRVLHSFDDMEVIEVGCPAEHETLVEHEIELPTPELRENRDYSGQRFVRHIAAETPTRPWRLSGWTARDSGIGAATDGLLNVQFLAAARDPSDEWYEVNEDFELLVVMRGHLVVEVDGAGRHPMRSGDSMAIPPGELHRLLEPSSDLELMEVVSR